MPTYVYECSFCEEQREEEQTIAEITERDPILVRKGCIKNPKGLCFFHRIIAPTNFILKGNGWAKDGYSK